MGRVKIAINTRLLLANKLEGIGWFTLETSKRMAMNHPEVDFYYFFDRNYSDEFLTSKNIIPIVLAPQARHPILFNLWFDYSVTRALKKYKIDLFLSPDGFLSLRSKVPSISVIHDLNFEFYPEDLPKNISRYYQSKFPKFARKADRIITVSNSSKKDLIEKYGIANEKIDVVHNGVNDSYGPVSESEKINTRDKYSNQERYFVYVGSMHKRKNIDRLLKAFDQYKNKSGSNSKMILVGEPMWNDPKFKQNINQLKNKKDIIFTGRVYNQELNFLLASSIALCYVPYFEGFGIPILEGFKAETAVITSNVSSMPEVAGDAALLVNPFDIEDLAQAMNRIESDEKLRSDLIEKGKERVLQFSWDKSAEEVWNAIQKVLNK